MTSVRNKNYKDLEKSVEKIIDKKITKIDEMFFRVINTKTENVYHELKDMTISKREYLDALENKKKGYEEIKEMLL